MILCSVRLALISVVEVGLMDSSEFLLNSVLGSHYRSSGNNRTDLACRDALPPNLHAQKKSGLSPPSPVQFSSAIPQLTSFSTEINLIETWILIGLSTATAYGSIPNSIKPMYILRPEVHAYFGQTVGLSSHGGFETAASTYFIHLRAGYDLGQIRGNISSVNPEV